jgi:hypothetical protein
MCAAQFHGERSSSFRLVVERAGPEPDPAGCRDHATSDTLRGRREPEHPALRCQRLGNAAPQSALTAEFRKGSFASLRRAARLRRMSAMPSIATESVRRNEPTRCAKRRPEQVQRTWWTKPCGYSITSSARASSVAGTSRPRAFAVLRLITSSNLVGKSTGSSPAFAPLRILST